MKIIDYAVAPPTETYAKDYASKHLENYSRIYKSELLENVDSFVKSLNQIGVTYAVIKARDIEMKHKTKIPNEHVAELTKRFPNNFIGMAGVDPLKGTSALEELEYAVIELGLKGLNLWTFEYDIFPNDRILYPLYEKCVELDIPVSIESSMHFSTTVPMDRCKPIYLDYVAVDFPELKIIGSTPGWPWVAELVGVAWRHKNVYIATSVTRPVYMGKQGMGYEPLLYLGNSILQDKIIFGSGYPLLPIKRSIEELQALPLKEHVKSKWLYSNAARLLKLE
jgi:uncharacterized protein